MKKLTSLFLLLFSLSIYAQSFNEAKLDSLFTHLDNQQQLMGSLAIFQNGDRVYTNSFGYKDVELRSKNNRHTLYRIGSISKTFTATIIMQLVEENKLQLDTKLDKYFPEIPNASKITIENLLAHQSGLYNFTDDENYLEWLEEPKSKSELLKIFKENKGNSEPKKNTNYSNTNYVLLSFIIEEVEGKDFGVVLEKRILKPLNLKRTRFGEKIKPKNNEALSYFGEKNWELAPQTNMNIPMGAGGIVSDVSELTEFFDALFNKKIIKKSSLNKMIEYPGDFGLGIFKIPYRDKTAYGHTGGIDGFQSISLYFPNEKTGISLLSNGSRTSLNDALLGALDIYFGYDYEIPTLKPIKNAELYTGVYSGENFPLELEIFEHNSSLYGKATGQSSFELKETSENNFEFKPANLQIEFFPEENSLKFTQNGFSFDLDKKKE